MSPVGDIDGDLEPVRYGWRLSRALKLDIIVDKVTNPMGSGVELRFVDTVRLGSGVDFNLSSINLYTANIVAQTFSGFYP